MYLMAVTEVTFANLEFCYFHDTTSKTQVLLKSLLINTT